MNDSIILELLLA